MTTLYLVRHGETEWNVIGRYQGQLDPPLNLRGHAQARRAAAHLAWIGVDAIYSSDLARAYQSAQPLCARTGLPIERDVRLREIHQGQWQGILTEEIRADWPEVLVRWQQQPWTCSPPGGETLVEVQTRLLSVMTDIAACHPAGRVAVFTHKLPIALLKIHYQRYDPGTLWSLLPANGAWEEIQVDPVSPI